MVSGCLPKKRAARQRQRQARVVDVDHRDRRPGNGTGLARRRSPLRRASRHPRHRSRRPPWSRRRAKNRHAGLDLRANPRRSPVTSRRAASCSLDRQDTGKVLQLHRIPVRRQQNGALAGAPRESLVGDQRSLIFMAEIWLHAKHRGRAADDVASDRRAHSSRRSRPCPAFPASARR